MTPERNYIIPKVKEWSKVLNNHPYHPSQVNWITQIAVLVIVKFSAALAQWDDASIRQLGTVIRQTQRKAWKLPPGCPDLALWAGDSDPMGLQLPGRDVQRKLLSAEALVLNGLLVQEVAITYQ
jgi:hypothetical protein